MTSTLQPTTDDDLAGGRILFGMVAMIVSAHLAAGLVALVWRFPLMMVGVEGGDLGAAYVAMMTVFFMLTFASFGLGLLVVGALGAAIGWVLRRRPLTWTIAATFGTSVLIALVIAAIPLW